MNQNAEDLLGHAARCYRRAGMADDACRCLDLAGRYGDAALLHQQAKRWANAAFCFENTSDWRAAARCHLENRQPAAAARCLLAAGDRLEAGWILAHLARQASQARAVLAELRFDTLERQLALALAKGRTELPGNPAPAGRAVRQVIARLAETTPGQDRDRMLDWALILTQEAMDRPDLCAALLAAISKAGVPNGRERWERWAENRLGGAEVGWAER